MLESHATLRILSDALVIDQITQILGIAPTNSYEWRKIPGKPVLADGRMYASWSLHAPCAPELPLSDHIGWLLGQLIPRRAEMASLLSSGAEIYVYCSVLAEGSRDKFALEASHLAELGALGIPLTFHIPPGGIWKQLKKMRLDLRIEPRSLYTWPGGLDPKLCELDDGLSRILFDGISPIHYPLPQTAEEALLRSTWPGIPAFVGLVAQDLAPDGEPLWMIGEARRPFCDAFVKHSGFQVSRFYMNNLDDLLFFKMPAGSITTETKWIAYIGDYGLRILCVNHSGSTQSPIGVKIRQAESTRAEADVCDLWSYVKTATDSRSGMTDLCRDCRFVILPDGVDTTQISLNTLMPVEDVLQAIRRLASEHSMGVRMEYS